MNSVRIAIAQINTIVGDIPGNKEKILFCIKEAIQKRSDLVVFPELSVTGCPPEDLVLKKHFIKENLRSLNDIAGSVKDIIAIAGFVDRDNKGIYNSAAVLGNKKVLYTYHKMHLRNYGAFDEKRYFRPGSKNEILKAGDFSFSVNICEDIWGPGDITAEGLDFLVNISSSPYYLGKIKEREDLLRERARTLKIPIVYCNLVGGQDELIFDGRSAVFSNKGEIVAASKAFQEDLLLVDLTVQEKKKSARAKKIKAVTIPCKIKEKKKILQRPKVKDMPRLEEVYSALMLGVRDYVRKNNFKKVTLGLSGGIDSALVACVAVDALGRANVLAVSMPSRYSSKATQDDAETISKKLGIRFTRIPIDDIFDAYRKSLDTHFTGMDPDVTEENIQARIRGNILMAFSNKFGYLVLNTGNKSETSIGYCTLYGDMAGGFAVIKDVPKNLVYELAGHINNKKGKMVIPKSVFKRSPSAELRPGQKDEDTLPSYELLDELIDLYIEKDRSLGDIVRKIGDKDVVKRVLRMIDMNEYKRRQSPPGIKITPRAFGKDRRMPITNKFREA
jgi:NAD+ synthase (glutamine-hydrolysing)